MKTGIEIIAERESKAFTANGMSREELRRPPGGGGELQLMYRPYFKERIADFDISTLGDQELFKKLCWQIVEELAGAKELWSLKYQVNMFHIKSKY